MRRFYLLFIFILTVLTVDAQIFKNRIFSYPVPATIEYQSSCLNCDFNLNVVVYRQYYRYQLRGEGIITCADQEYTYHINGYMSPVGDGLYSGPFILVIKDEVGCVERSSGTATFSITTGVSLKINVVECGPRGVGNSVCPNPACPNPTCPRSFCPRQ